MEQLPSGEPIWDLKFNEKGLLTAPATDAFLEQIAAEDITDLFIFSHGWGTSETGARDLYDAMFPLLREAACGVPSIDRVGLAGVFWPSLWFPDTPATPPRPVGSTQAGDNALQEESAGTAVLSGADIAASLLPGFEDPQQQQTVVKIGQLIDEGEAAIGSGEPDTVKEQRLQQLNRLLQSLLPPDPGGEYEDQGETTILLTNEPKRDYQAAAEVFGSAPPGSSGQGLGDWFGKAINGAKDVMRVFSYTIMKARAGDIGRTGLGPLLVALHRRSPGVRVHLIGHSFGARLVSFALAGIGAPSDSPVASLLLVQAAFSHWSFAHAQDNPFGNPGALHNYANRVHGPLVATFSVHDWAVGRWYPKASFLSRQDTQAGVAGRWDGLGADGYQAVSPAADRIMSATGGLDYQFASGTFYRVNAVEVINNVEGQPFAGAHSDIRKPALAQLAVAAAAAHA
ncbi:hypothetical protein D1O33_24595 (plasmid) [Rhodococcus rhodochrous]|uniref:hypothetical protein n=1 Tax=Rhodococcus rhodochrous TaxID=1829 RepID=UPI00132F300B|nr:hypothetical protein [Rhodococcus rhodochrous]QHG85252.1 hypothetical protein D1O33_24595 [Rhodococcus rhodochrous]